ncbi:hypothetical protein [Phaffia rhodozyma]|uniref:Uncharacterized protein n=1 Tax=Phaffia rhodozyma TaxID=264483 RepID=A0A0F7SPW0_PHARH|nr:hypothetical protein [Phaffia rhodozyma]
MAGAEIYSLEVRRLRMCKQERLVICLVIHRLNPSLPPICLTRSRFGPPEITTGIVLTSHHLSILPSVKTSRQNSRSPTIGLEEATHAHAQA